MVDAQVLGNSRPPQPPHVSEGQLGTSESQGADSKPELLGISTPAVGVITPNVFKQHQRLKKLERTQGKTKLSN